MKICTSGSLKTKSVISSQRKRSLLFFQMFRGLSYLHQEWLIIHRDVKPENLLVEEDPKTGSPNLCLADFGLSVIQDTPKQNINIILERAKKFIERQPHTSSEDRAKKVDEITIILTHNLQQRTRRRMGTLAYMAPEIVSFDFWLVLNIVSKWIYKILYYLSG